jgi:hypothetical protein
MIKLSLPKHLFHISKGSLTCRKILQHETDGFTPPPLKEGLLIFILLKVHRPRPGLNPRTLGPMASTLNITPPMTT